MDNCWSLHYKRSVKRGLGSSYKLTDMQSALKLTINCPASSQFVPGSCEVSPGPLDLRAFPLTCVEDAGSQGGRCGLVQQQLPHHHPGWIPGELPLEEPHPEEIGVTMETESDNGDVPCVAPVDLVLPWEPLVDEVPSGEQTAVQCHVGDPGEPTDVSQKRVSLHFATSTKYRVRKM